MDFQKKIPVNENTSDDNENFAINDGKTNKDIFHIESVAKIIEYLI